MKNSKSVSTQKLVLLALLTAIVVVLQLVGSAIRFGPFSISLVLLPIVIGAALIGPWAGVWLGLAFGLVVLLSGDAGPFLVLNPFATAAVVILKGMLAGFAAGIVYKLPAQKNQTIAAILAALVCPIVNTAIFVAGVYAFFLPLVTQWSEAAGFADATAYIFLGMIGVNFLLELGLNIVLSPVIVRLIRYGQERKAGS